MQPVNRFGGGGNLYGGPSTMGMQIPQNRGTTGYTNSSLGMMMMTNSIGGVNIQQGGMNVQQTIQEKERQIQQIKSQYPNIQHKNVSNNNQPVDLVEVTLQIKTNEVQLQVPLALILDVRFPMIAPKIYVRSKLKHNLFDVRDQVIEMDVNNVTQWVPQQSTLADILSRLRAIFEKDPPKQEKIIEEVNKMLAVVTEQNFRDLVEADCLSTRSAEELKQLQGISFQEVICSSGEYKKIGQNLLDVINFNERVANELIQKKEDLEQHKQQLLLVSERIEGLTREYNDRVSKCKGFKDAFSRQNLESFVNKEIKNLDSQSLSLESVAQNSQGNIIDVLQQYLDTRKNYHKLNILKMRLPELKYQ